MYAIINVLHLRPGNGATADRVPAPSTRGARCLLRVTPTKLYNRAVNDYSKTQNTIKISINIY